MNYYYGREERKTPLSSDRKSAFLEFKEFIYEFIEGTTLALTRPLSKFILEQRNNMIKKLSATAILIIGLTFLLLGIVKFINTFLGLGDWTGYLLVGIVLFLAGIIMQRFDYN